jgi:pyridoxamine 5'-phosphate oxidase-like protein
VGKTYDLIDQRLADFMGRQHVFFVGTAPAGSDGHVNVSPKGLDTFAILGPTTVAYLDLTGSGIETVAHLRENGRITMMFCAFEGAPKILRLYGRGEVIEAGEPEFEELRALFPTYEGARGVIRVELTRIADSCGYAVPTMSYEGDRDVLAKWTRKQGAEGVVAYRAETNSRSIDGLPGLPSVARR